MDEKSKSQELTDEDLQQVSGGEDKKTFEIKQDVTVNKAKTADKAYNAWSDYIRG